MSDEQETKPTETKAEETTAEVKKEEEPAAEKEEEPKKEEPKEEESTATFEPVVSFLYYIKNDVLIYYYVFVV